MSVLVEKTDFSLKLIGHYNEVKAQLETDSPALINNARKKAFQDFVLQGIPTFKNENYKYTNLQPLFFIDYSYNHIKEKSDVNLKEVFRCNVPQLDTHLVLNRNGWFCDNNNESNLPEGIIINSLRNIAKTNPELIQDFYAKIANTEEDPMVALNTAMATDGYVIYIPPNVQFDKAIQVINLMENNSDTFITQRNLIIADPGSKVSVLICDHTLNNNKYLGNSVTEVFAGENAQIDYYTIQNQHNNSATINSLFIKQERDSNVLTNTMTLHGGLIRNNLKVLLNGENCNSDILGMAFMDRKQHIDNFTQIIHAKPHCLSNQLYKNVLDDESTGVFSGRIHVVRDAQKTNAFQRNNNLLLTDQAKMNTKPQLIIDADDVKCSHGATVGQIDEEALFYIRSRGIAEKDARLMMMNAFAHEVIQEVKLEPLRDRIDELVDKRLRGEIARCHDCSYDCDC
ncbi:MAG: Fe-S cluster assembly protein SufD [Prolixibacteraceae bacterium]|nr:Fe-S cluster assembly protein SufD [Prolixibacteraceae bacterium]MBN2774759.1 Fe-S cluster assembly protein SufD [Prolixibacteraceae bacterium]